jgi:predicted RNA-binding protein Jag
MESQALEQVSGDDQLSVADDREYVKALRAATKTKALLALHGPGIDKIIDIAAKGKDGEALRAIQMLGQLTGDLKSGHSVEVKLSFDQLRQKRQENGSEAGGLFEIRGEVIEGDIEEYEPDSD